MGRASLNMQLCFFDFIFTKRFLTSGPGVVESAFLEDLFCLIIDCNFIFRQDTHRKVVKLFVSKTWLIHVTLFGRFSLRDLPSETLWSSFCRLFILANRSLLEFLFSSCSGFLIDSTILVNVTESLWFIVGLAFVVFLSKLDKRILAFFSYLW